MTRATSPDSPHLPWAWSARSSARSRVRLQGTVRLLSLTAILLSLLGSAAALAAPAVMVPGTTERIVLDGIDAETVWVDAAVLDGFTVYEPRTDVPPRFSVGARVLTTDDALFFHIKVNVPERDTFAPLGARDTNPSADYVEIQLDPWGDGRRGYRFRVSAAGVLHDMTTDDLGGSDSAWNSLFDAATHIGPEAWTAEIRIPFRSLRFDPNNDTWGAHVIASSWRHQQTLSWAPVDRDSNAFLAQAGRLGGLGTKTPGRAVEVLPELTASWRSGADGDCALRPSLGRVRACGGQLAFGLAGKWGLTPSLTADAVVNPDFSHVEADPGQLTLNNRFALFLSERRPFFLEGRDVFENPLGVVYTRSIGRPELAVKTTGRAGAWQVGVLAARDGAPPGSVIDGALSTPDGQPAHTSVLRLQRDIGRGAVGGYLIHKDLGDDAFNIVQGADVEGHLTGRLYGDLSAFTSQSRDHDERRRSGVAARGKLTWQSDSFRLQTLGERVSDDFRSEAGFIPRTGFTRGYTKADWYYRSEGPWARFVSPGIWVDHYLADGSGRIEERTVGANTYWEFGGRSWVFAYLTQTEQLVDGELRAERFAELSAGTSRLRWLSVDAGMTVARVLIRDPEILGASDPFLGAQLGPSASLSLRPTTSLEITGSWRNRVFFDELGGEQLASQPLWRGQLEYFLVRDASLRHIFEYRQRDELVTNSALITWRPVPGALLFLGYREETPLREGESIRTVFVKASNVLAF